MAETAVTIERELAEVAQAAMARHGVPGMAVGLRHAGQEHLVGFGVTNVEHPLPVDADTIFQIASISKTFTATVTMRLVERGLIDLDAPVRRYVPEFKLQDEATAAAITVRHLFQHTSGFSGDYMDAFGRGDDALARYVASMDCLEQVTPLGRHFSYNNAAFNVAGRVVETVTGQPFEQVLRELVLAPIGLDHTFTAPEEVLTHRFVSGHVLHDGQPVVVRPWGFARNCVPAFGLASTVRDLVRYARVHMGDGTTESGERLLKPETLQVMQEPAVRSVGMGEGVGIAWMIDRSGGIKLVGHGGTSNGQRSILRFAPGRDFAVCVLSNSMLGGFAIGEVAKWAVERCLGVATPEPARVAVDPATLDQYAGRYAKLLSEFEIRVENGELVLHPIKGGGVAPTITKMPLSEPARLAFTGPNHVVSVGPGLTGSHGEFVRGENGQVEFFHWGGRLTRRAGA